MFLQDVPSTSPIILVHAASTHDLIHSVWRWTLEARGMCWWDAQQFGAAPIE
jgi:hypothetical protein